MKSNVVRKALLAGVSVLAATPAFSKDWDFALTPYLWFAGLEGDVATIPGAPAGPIDISPGDALEGTESSLMLWFDVRRGQHGLFADFLYSDVRMDAAYFPNIDLTLRSISKTTLLSLGYNYQLFRDDRAVVDFMIGARYWDIDTTMTFSGGLGILDGKTVNHDESWIDPFVAFKGRTFLGQSRFYAGGAFAVGGLGVGSDLFYDITANIGYQWNKSIGTGIGYRYYSVDYEEDLFLYDVVQQGWNVSLIWLF